MYLFKNTKRAVLSKALSTKPPSLSPEQKIMSIHAHTHFEEGNSPYVTSFENKRKLGLPPVKHLVIASLVYNAAWDLLALVGNALAI